MTGEPRDWDVEGDSGSNVLTEEPAEDIAKRQVMEQFANTIREMTRRQRQAIEAAQPALKRLVEMCRHASGQSYKVRALLYSVWSGQATSLLELVAVDWQVKADVCAVLLAFGCEPVGGPPFFYDEIRDAFEAEGLTTWFLEAHRVEKAS